MAQLNFFNPKRTQPFIITLFMAIMAFKRVCKMMKKRMFLLKKRTHSHQLSGFHYQLKKSNMEVIHASWGRDVIQSNFIQTHLLAQQNPQPKSPITLNETKTVRKISTHKKVSRYLDDYAVKLRLGKGAPATVDRLEKVLVVSHHGIKPNSSGKVHVSKRKSTMMMSAMKTAATTKPIDFSKSSDVIGKHGPSNHVEGEDEDASGAAGGEEEVLGYEAGTSIYFGATIALQARHGGYLSYNSSEIKASAHKVLSNSRFVVKNSEDLTDAGVMRYGAALWLQAGHHDVLGAQYGTLVDQKRTIQPALVSCKRSSMFKAQQYGRWIILNRANPMETLGQPVLHDDKVMLEQEWFFLASASPYQSSMYKTLNNSDEAMTTKTELFNPGDECSWKVHLVALPSEDKAGELQRQLLLQQAKECLDESAVLRYEKAPSLLTSLQSKLPEELTDEAMVHNVLHRKLHLHENQEHLLHRYHDLASKQFHSSYNPIKFLSHIYGAESNIVKYKTFVLERNESDITNSLNDSGQQAVYNPNKTEVIEQAPRNPIEIAEEDYWDRAQGVLLDTKSWVELPTAMTRYYKTDRAKKIRAASVLQKWIRKFLNSNFDFERKMKNIDTLARNKLQEKLIARRKFLIEHVSAIDAMDHIEKVSSVKFGLGGQIHSQHASASRQRGKQAGSMSSTMNSFSNPARASSVSRAGSISIDNQSSLSAHHHLLHNSGHHTRHQNQRPPSSRHGSVISRDSPNPQSERCRSKSVVPLSRSQSIAQMNDISHLVGAVGMAAIFSAAGLIPPSAAPLASIDSVAGRGRSQSLIFHKTAIEEHDDSERWNTSNLDDENADTISKPAPGLLTAQHKQYKSLSSLPVIFDSPNSGASSRKQQDVLKDDEEALQSSARDSFPGVEPMSVHRQDQLLTFEEERKGLYTDCGKGIAYLNNANEETDESKMILAPSDDLSPVAIRRSASLYVGDGYEQRPHTANAAVQPAKLMVDSCNWEHERVLHEAHKLARKELIRAETLNEKRRLCWSASNEFGLPRDVFRDPKGEVSAVIGLKFLRAVSKNPSIYDGVKLRKRPSSGAHESMRSPKIHGTGIMNAHSGASNASIPRINAQI